MVAGLFCIMFGLIASVGLSQMQHTDQNSPRCELGALSWCIAPLQTRSPGCRLHGSPSRRPAAALPGPPCISPLTQPPPPPPTKNRNLFIIGFALFMGLSVPDYFDKFNAKNGRFPIQSSNQAVNGGPAAPIQMRLRRRLAPPACTCAARCMPSCAAARQGAPCQASGWMGILAASMAPASSCLRSSA
jgi:hypothetical protein